MRWRERPMLSIWRRAWLSSIEFIACLPSTVRACVWNGVSLRAVASRDEERADAHPGGA